MLIWTIVVHAAALSALIFNFDIKLFAMAFGLAMLTAYSMGIFHHMQLTHASFESRRWVTWLGSLFGTLTWRGAFAPPLKYAAIHQIHHEYADTELDPHSPVDGLGHAFMGWFWNQFHGLYKIEEYENYVREEFRNDRVLRFMDRNPNLLQLVYGALLFAVGGLLGDDPTFDLPNAGLFLLYGVFVKTWIVLWAANAVDVINHTIGYRNYETKEKSTNSWLMAILHLGGAISWHNNHHAHPDYFSVRHKWWEFDVHRMFLRVLEKFGLVWNIGFRDEVPAKRVS